MQYVIIGAILIIGLLTGLTALSVLMLARRVGSELNAKSIQLLSPYDRKLEEKAKRLEELQQQLESSEKEIPVIAEEDTHCEQTVKTVSGGADVLSVIEKINSASYIDKQSLTVYRKIKKAFVASPEHVQNALARIPRQKADKRAATLLNSLSFETMYELSTLSPEAQEKLLRESLDSSSLELLDEFERNNSKFSALSFYDELGNLADESRKAFVLYVSRDDAFRDYGSDVEVKTDDNICEGFVIQSGNTIYDYSIKENETL